MIRLADIAWLLVAIVLLDGIQRQYHAVLALGIKRCKRGLMGILRGILLSALYLPLAAAWLIEKRIYFLSSFLNYLAYFFFKVFHPQSLTQPIVVSRQNSKQTDKHAFEPSRSQFPPMFSRG
jgi:hypothetical protein